MLEKLDVVQLNLREHPRGMQDRLVVARVSLTEALDIVDPPAQVRRST